MVTLSSDSVICGTQANIEEIILASTIKDLDTINNLLINKKCAVLIRELPFEVVRVTEFGYVFGYGYIDDDYIMEMWAFHLLIIS